jgi:hypothetical protein
VWAYLGLRIYKAKSWAYRWLFEGRYRDVKVFTYATLQLLAARLRPSWYRPDGWRQLFDAVSYPGRVEAIWESGVPPKDGLDCDEYAIYSVAAVEKSLASGLMRGEGITNPRLMTVMWLCADAWRPEGHNVCLMEVPQGEGRFSKWTYMDYGNPGPHYESYADVATAIVTWYAGGPAVLLGYAVQRLDLTPEVVYWG